MADKKWNYVGDMHLENGGFFWKKGNETDDFVSYVGVYCDGDIGGADNVFWIETGAIYIGDEKRYKPALEATPNKGECNFSDLVMAIEGYYGAEIDNTDYIRIGKIDPLTGDSTVRESDILQIRGNNKLKNYIKRYLN